MARQPLPTRVERRHDPVRELRTIADMAAITLLGAGALLLLLPDTLVVSPQIDAAVVVTSAVLLCAATAGARGAGAGPSTAGVAVGLVLASTWALVGLVGEGLTTAAILTTAGAVQAALALHLARRAAASTA